ncbi:hypothetical protein LPTSP3_g10940 [Leptospira kobayashii]|uniref:Uncharacterized protein n=1 Tax=Leptospira kobayashii TaxID=1917830 RepID=A0ABM7UQZ1_9LEPT|nr:hypothetical protein [Leptospira kobayashii]BDA78164.1 hypothetical protein LPTSP3_g10940 [Leptospira kobayashii]
MVSESLKQIDPATLLWKAISRQNEFQAGNLRLNPEITIRTFKNQAKRYLQSERYEFTVAMKELLKPIATLDNEKVEYLIFRIYESFYRELHYWEDPRSRFSIDIVFQFIEFLCTEGPKEDLATVLQRETSLNKKEVESIITHIKVFNKLGAYFTKSPSLKKTIENGEPILTTIAAAHTEVTWLALESMFYLLVAQHALASKYSCESLLRGWMTEYGFDENQYAVVANYFPPGTSLHDFRGNYTSALRTLHGLANKEKPDYDLLLLRSIGNYFSSWIVRVAHQMEAGYQAA